MLDNLTADDFSSSEGSTFKLTGEGIDGVDFVLLDVSGGETIPDHRTPFSLDFETAETLELRQGTYTIEGADCGPLEVFLVPIGPGKLQAVFG